MPSRIIRILLLVAAISMLVLPTALSAAEINIGINSGEALVGAARFDSLAGSRWTYTARGSLINVAARIGALAKGGQTFLSKATAERVTPQIDLKKVGHFTFKNLKDKVSVYQLL